MLKVNKQTVQLPLPTQIAWAIMAKKSNLYMRSLN